MPCDVSTLSATISKQESQYSEKSHSEYSRICLLSVRLIHLHTVNGTCCWWNGFRSLPKCCDFFDCTDFDATRSPHLNSRSPYSALEGRFNLLENYILSQVNLDASIFDTEIFGTVNDLLCRIHSPSKCRSLASAHFDLYRWLLGLTGLRQFRIETKYLSPIFHPNKDARLGANYLNNFFLRPLFRP